jgi:hypothetical protein
MTDWSAFEFHYRERATAITVEQISPSAELRDIVAELHEKLDQEPASAVKSTLLQQLEASRHGLLFELPDDLPDDVWEMLDATEAYFADVCEGFIVAHEGLFDANLNLILRWSRPGI